MLEIKRYTQQQALQSRSFFNYSSVVINHSNWKNAASGKPLFWRSLHSTIAGLELVRFNDWTNSNNRSSHNHWGTCRCHLHRHTPSCFDGCRSCCLDRSQYVAWPMFEAQDWTNLLYASTCLFYVHKICPEYCNAILRTNNLAII